MSWNITFISEQELTDHVRATIQKYGDKLESFDLKRFNKNIVDPVKLIFDKTVYRATWEETISNEIFRQRDKANNNDIGLVMKQLNHSSQAVSLRYMGYTREALDKANKDTVL